jgi:raffinose/stachyose/melibiose transport system substrate-binding protein
MRKTLALALAATMTLSVALAGCGTTQSSDSGSSGDGGGSSESSAITLLNGKPEIDEQMQELAAKYKEETGNELTVMTIGGQETSSSKLKELKQANEMPDIFVAEANQFANWSGELVDLAGEQWTEDTDVEYVDDEMGTIGFPYMVEAHGLAYNADILKAAGVDPAELTSPDAFKKAFETIDSKKSELGIDGVVSYAANATNVGWSSGTHIFGHYLDAGLKPEDTTYIDLLNDGGKLDEKRFTDFGEFIALLNKYAVPKVLVDGDYDQQVAAFAGGKAAFITQGSWIGASLTSSDSYTGFECGFVPFAFEDGIDTILDEPTSYWTVYKDGNVDAAKEFLQWASDDTAQQIFVEKMGFVSPYSDCKYTASDPFAAAVTKYISDGKHSAYHTFFKKDGLQDATSVVFQDFAKGDIKDAAEFYEKMQKVTTDYYAQGS